MRRWGVTYDSLRGIRPDIIWVSQPGMGHGGPSTDYRTMGPIVQALGGLTFLGGLPDQPPSGWGYSYMDHTSGYYAAMAVMHALHYRLRTGKGQFIDQAQVETTASLTGTTILDYTVNGRRAQRYGNRIAHPAGAPYGTYRCAGEDEWVGVSVMDDEEWEAFCRALGNPAWCRETRFATHVLRLRHQDELDALVEEWTKPRDKYEVMEKLQAAGVAAGALQNAKDRYERDPQLRSRGVWVKIDHPSPDIGSCEVEGMPPKLSRTSVGPRFMAPLPREHNGYVYGELLGIPEAQIEAYTERKTF